MEAPPGWFLVRGSPLGGANDDDPPRGMGTYAIDTADGRIVPLPAIGEWLVQG